MLVIWKKVVGVIINKQKYGALPIEMDAQLNSPTIAGVRTQVREVSHNSNTTLTHLHCLAEMEILPQGQQSVKLGLYGRVTTRKIFLQVTHIFTQGHTHHYILYLVYLKDPTS